MLVLEVISISGTLILAALTYRNYIRSSQILKQTRAKYNEIEQIHDKAQQRYLEILRARDQVASEGQRIASVWHIEHLN